MSKLILYNVADEYINFLRTFDKKVFSNKEDDRKKERKYLGILLKINDLNYFVPLSSPKETDYIIVDGKKVIRNNVIPIMRIISRLCFKSMLKLIFNRKIGYNIDRIVFRR